jgi:hypothetical protein
MPSTRFADELRYRFAPVMTDDLSVFIGGIAAMFAEIELLSREDDDGNPPWSQIMDVDLASTEFALLWLAQMAGVRVPVGMEIEDMRDFIRLAESRRRGTIAYMVEIAQRYLTGDKTVVVFERVDGFAYRLRIVTRDDETADPDAVEAALLAVKPAGIVLEYGDVDGVTWSEAISAWNSAGAIAWDDTSDEVP